ncbi:MAG: branched-chain amino acid aminotransferase [Verrucomicrobiales bacterium]|jgi:branched-chain amino acid aminotransferase
MNQKNSPETQTCKVWMNGELIDESAAHISPFDHGLLTGDGVFETLIAYGDKPFATTLHWARLRRSAAVFGLDVPDEATLNAACEATMEANGISPSRLRVTITGGRAPLGSEKGDSGQTIIIAVGDLPGHGPEAIVHTVVYSRNERGATAGTKTISYGDNVIALAEAKAKGGTEAIFGNTQGHLCEGTGSNIFIIRAGRLITPTLESGCLAGCTRAVVLMLCKQEGIEVFEEDTPLAELGDADEAFLTSTLREVQPIASADGMPFKTVNGEITRRLAAAFKAKIVVENDPC